MFNSSCFSSMSSLWSTPQYIFDQLNSEFHFTLDVCALPDNAKCENFYTPSDNGLLCDWFGVCWCNPPYGRELYRWVEKAYISSLSGVTSVLLVPSRTDTKWFHKFVLPFAEIRFLDHRLKFGGSSSPAPFPSMIVIFRCI